MASNVKAYQSKVIRNNICYVYQDLNLSFPQVNRILDIADPVANGLPPMLKLPPTIRNAGAFTTCAPTPTGVP